MKIPNRKMINIVRIAKLMLVILLIMFLFGYIMTLIEPQTFPSLLDGIWWTLSTISTVGFGDFVPHTPTGKLMGMLLIFVGAGFIAAFFTAVTTTTLSPEEEYMSGTQQFHGTNHIIIIGWNERSKNMIQVLQSEKARTPIVLIDQTLRQHPNLLGNYHFIHGNATEDDILKKANIFEASKLLITANTHLDEFSADMFSILTLIACKGLNSNVYSCIEILTSSQIKNAKRAGADQIVQTNALTCQHMKNFVDSN